MNRRGFFRTASRILLLWPIRKLSALENALSDDAIPEYEPFLKYLKEHGDDVFGAVDYREAIVPGTPYRLEMDIKGPPKFLSLINRSPGKKSYFDIDKDGHVDIVLQNNPNNPSLLDEGEMADSLEFAVNSYLKKPVKKFNSFGIYSPPSNEDVSASFLKELSTLKEKIL